MLVLLASLAANALGAMLGMAGGIFLVPLLTMAFGVPIEAAIGASLVAVVGCSCAAAAPSLRAGLTNLRLAIVLEIATTIGAVTGVALAGCFAARFLFGLFALVLLVSAWQMRALRRGEPVIEGPAGWLDGTYRDASGAETPYRVQRLKLGLALMYGAGLLSAMLGIGSGVLKIPAMDTALRLPIKVSSATSNLMIGITATASAGALLVHGHIDLTLAGPCALGAVIGAVIGTRVLFALAPARLRTLFVIILVVLAVAMALAALGVDARGLSPRGSAAAVGAT